jgi:hypothetical protein
VHQRLAEEDERNLEQEELERLARAVEVQEKLIRKEKERLGAPTTELQELNRLKRAYDLHKKFEQQPADPILLEEAEFLAHCYHLQKELTRKHSLENQELDRLLSAYHVHDELTRRDDRRLANEELDRLVAAAEIEKRLIDLEESK